jgi:vitamin B12 transporter
VDGVQVNRAGGGFDFSTLTLDNVERIDVARGPSSALYGSDAMAGVVHVITRLGRGTPRLRASVEATSFSEPRNVLVDGARWTAGALGGGDRFGYSASLSRETNEGLLAFNNRFERSAFSGRAAFAPDDRTRVDLTVGLTDREFQRPTDGSGEVVDRNALDFGDELLAHLRLSRAVSPRIELQGRLSVSEADSGTDDAPDDDFDPDGFFSLDHFRRTSAELRADVRFGSAVLTAGGELEEERQRSFNESSSAFGTSHGRSEDDRSNRAVFLHGTAQQGLVSFNAGTRLEQNERFGRGLTWQVGVSTAVPGLASTRLRGSFGTAIKEPSFFENFATGFVTGNPSLDPERSRSWEVGLRHDVSRVATLQATFFDQRLEDLIQFTFAPPDPDDPNYFNVAGAATRGLEVDAELHLNPVEVGTSYTWLQTEVTNAGFDEGPGAELVTGERLLRRPTHTFALRGAARLGERARVHSSLSFVGERSDRSFDPETFTPSRRDLSGYVLWSAGGSWDALPATSRLPSLTLSIRVENLLDESYEEAWGFASAGRQLFLGASVAVGDP